MSLDIISFTYYLGAMDTMPPEKHLGFLINDVARLLRRAFDQAAQSCALTRAQWQVLAFLYHNEGSNQAVVAEALDVEPITLSRHIDRLEGLGYVVRLPDPSDRRARRLQLTPAVKPHLQAMKAIANDVLKSALEGMDETETAQLANALTLMRANMARYGAEPASDCVGAIATADCIPQEEKSLS
ncbi:DNA-binding transcriptional regulator, MarR family [Kaistia soli DSM 19436]|uniref:DNA-binding transcriptional regulator, MarR family n=1 Tax=Kaistia soli DSM 19436 TaxID=1122133 RepID=A0A1M5JG56_9HYPH|nr:MarR family transcriptional regulator [Kaistia soli]SHG39554.1 DNA-binding transcriptional regulator, MarR family [Kaistia soli DSM 19436]